MLRMFVAFMQYQDPSNPNWEFQMKIIEFKANLDVDPLLEDEPVSLRTLAHLKQGLLVYVYVCACMRVCLLCCSGDSF